MSDATSNIGKVRILIADVAATPADGRIFTAEQISMFLELGDGNPFEAASLALLAIAASEVLVQKRIRLLDLTTDGPAEARELRALAETMRARAEESWDLAIHEPIGTVFAARHVATETHYGDLAGEELV